MTLEKSTQSIRIFLVSINPQGVYGVQWTMAKQRYSKRSIRSLVEVARIPRDGLFEIEAIASVL